LTWTPDYPGDTATPPSYITYNLWVAAQANSWDQSYVPGVGTIYSWAIPGTVVADDGMGDSMATSGYSEGEWGNHYSLTCSNSSYSTTVNLPTLTMNAYGDQDVNYSYGIGTSISVAVTF